MKFIKMHGLGNDFIILNNFDGEVEDPAALSALLCNRHLGIGGDGLVLILPSSKAAARMRIFNPDGSEAEMCGNALRCIAKYLYDTGKVKEEFFTIETMKDFKHVNLEVSKGEVENVEVDMGEPILDSVDIPVTGTARRIVEEKLLIEDEEVKFTAVSMGNPHCILFVDSVDKAPVTTLGPKVEEHSSFPQKTNVEFVEVLDRNNVKMRVWERGVGETSACGTGACATAVASALKGVTDRQVTVKLLEGDLIIKWQENNRVLMKGPAEYAFKGEIAAELLKNIT